MLSLLPIDVLGYLIGFIPFYMVMILHYVDKATLRKIKHLITTKRIDNHSKSSLYTHVVKENGPLKLIIWGRRAKFSWPRTIYDTVEKHERWDVLKLLRAEKRLHPNLPKEVSLFIKSRYQSKYLYERDSGKWWQYSVHRWYPMDISPLKALYREAKEYYKMRSPKVLSSEWKKLLGLLPSLVFQDAVLKDAERIMQNPTICSVPQTSNVCCANGIVDTTTMRLRDGTPEDGMFQGSEVEYEYTQRQPMSSFTSNSGLAFLSFCRNAFLGVSSNAFFVVQASNYFSVLQSLKNVMGDYAEFYNPSKTPYVLKRCRPKMTVIECDYHVTAHILRSILACGALNVVLVCKKLNVLDPQIFTDSSVTLFLGDGQAIDEQSLLFSILNAPPFSFSAELAEECKRNASNMDMYNRFVTENIAEDNDGFLNPSEACIEFKAWAADTYPNIRMPHPTTVRKKLEEKLGSWRGYALVR